MTKLANIYDRDVKTHLIAGQWLVNCYIENLGRPSVLEVTVVEGTAYAVGNCGDYDKDRPLRLDEDGAIYISHDVSFLPDHGELDRAGIILE